MNSRFSQFEYTYNNVYSQRVIQRKRNSGNEICILKTESEIEPEFDIVKERGSRNRIWKWNVEIERGKGRQ
jgi:hypothetical protein